MVSLGSTGTLAQLYAKLTSDAASNAWPKFKAAVDGLRNVTNDDPFAQLHAQQVSLAIGGNVSIDTDAAQRK
jgi:hypothetical protein